MARQWNNWKSQWDTRDNWQYRDEEPDYGWLKRTIAAAVIFAMVYSAHLSDTSIGRMVGSGVTYFLNVHTDFNYMIDQAVAFAPANIDTSLLQRAKAVMSKPADPLMYMTKPVPGQIMAGYGWRTHPVLKKEMMQEGLEFEAPLGTGVRAAAAGTVKAVEDSAQRGKTITIDHGKELETVYGHLSEVLVQPGDVISQGQIVAKSGKSGIASGPVLYFELREKGQAIDPATRLKGEFPPEGGK